MATVVFDGGRHTLTLLDSNNRQVGQWRANNVVDHRATLRFIPNGTYHIIDPFWSHRHGGAADTPEGPYGSYGIIRLQQFAADGHVHSGVGIHAGRAGRGGPDHATMGCIRTTEAAMQGINQHIQTDALLMIQVRFNHVQHNPHPQHPGDHHHH
jgi:L,D-transpeptidase-like protein